MAQRTPRQGDYAGRQGQAPAKSRHRPQGARDRGYVQPRTTHTKSATQTATRRAPVALGLNRKGVPPKGYITQAELNAPPANVAAKAWPVARVQAHHSTDGVRDDEAFVEMELGPSWVWPAGPGLRQRCERHGAAHLRDPDEAVQARITALEQNDVAAPTLLLGEIVRRPSLRG